MCLLIVVSRLDPTSPLVIGANRDERLDRPATAMTVLRDADPRILGGRDEEAGGTWLAVNEHGVVAGLTNRPSPDGRDPAKRSRGELPVALAQHRDAASAVEEFVATRRPADYNPAWLLVGDRDSLYSLDMTGSGDPPGVETLGPGVHILENNPLHVDSSKAGHVRTLLGDAAALGGEDLVHRVRAVLVDHTVPGGSESGDVGRGDAGRGDAGRDDAGRGDAGRGDTGGDHKSTVRKVETLAACVHTDNYGTRSSTLVRVPAGVGRPQVLVADGHPCTSAFADVTSLFEP